MKTILKIICISFCMLMTCGGGMADTFAKDNLQDFESSTDKEHDTELLESFKGGFRTTTEIGGRGARDFLLKLAKDGKNVVFALSTIILLALVFRLLFVSNTEEEAEKFKKGVFRVVMGIILMQLSYSAVSLLYDRDVDEELAISFIDDLIGPIVDVLLFGASFAFLIIGIIAFFMLITAGGDEEKTTKGKQTVGYAIIGFLVVKFADVLVNSAYSGVYSNADGAVGGFIVLLAKIMDWVTQFLGLIIFILIVYAGVQIMLSNGDEEKLKNARRSILFIFIGIIILVFNYLIATFFIIPEITI